MKTISMPLKEYQQCLKSEYDKGRLEGYNAGFSDFADYITSNVMGPYKQWVGHNNEFFKLGESTIDRLKNYYRNIFSEKKEGGK